MVLISVNWRNVGLPLCCKVFWSMPLFIYNPGQIVSRSYQATTHSWLVSRLQTLMMLYNCFSQKTDAGVKNCEKSRNHLLDHTALSLQRCKCIGIHYWGECAKVLLIRSGILQKGLTAQWHSNSLLITEVSTNMQYITLIPDSWSSYILPPVASFVVPVGIASCYTLHRSR